MDKRTQQELNFVLSNRDVINDNHLSKIIHERRFSLKEVGVTYRWISHWHKKELLIGNYEEGKWRKFDLIEYVWLKMIIQMRNFNVSLETIKRIKNNLIQEVSVSEMIDQETVLDIMIKLAKEENREQIKEVLKDQNVIDLFKSQTINLFETLVMDIISLHNSFSIIISPTEVLPFKHSSLESILSTPAYYEIFKGSYISISLSEILRDYMLGEHGISQKNRLALLSESEEHVLNAIRGDNLKSVIVKYGINQEIDFLEIVKVEKIDKRARLMDFIMTNGYQDITIKTQNGEIVYCENKRKKAIK